MRKWSFLLLLGWFCLDGRSIPQTAAPGALTVEQIAGRMQAMNQERDAALKSYESSRVMSVTYKGTLGEGQATEAVVMTYTAPASKRFTVLSATGSAFIRESVFQREMTSEAAAAAPEARQSAALTPANYDMRLVGQERLALGDCYVIDVYPRTTSPFAYRGRVWVQSPDFAVVRIDAKPAQDPSTWVSAGRFTTEFKKVGDFYFPAETASSSQVLLGGEATLTIKYGDYRILQAGPAHAAAR